jgi:hypothetical protein
MASAIFAKSFNVAQQTVLFHRWGPTDDGQSCEKDFGKVREVRDRVEPMGRTLYYRGQTFKSCDGAGFKCNYFDAETEIGYWISGCKKDGRDRFYPGIIEIDDDVREE